MSHSVAAVLEYNFEFKSQCVQICAYFRSPTVRASVRAVNGQWGQHSLDESSSMFSKSWLPGCQTVWLRSPCNISIFFNESGLQRATQLTVFPVSSYRNMHLNWKCCLRLSNTNGSNNYKHCRRWRGRGQDKYWITHRTADVIYGIVIH